MALALVIDAQRAEVRGIELAERESARVAVLHAIVGGYLELAHMWPAGDCLFVNEDADRLALPQGFFLLPPATKHRRLIRGSAVVVGREVEGDYPDGWAHLDVAMSEVELRGVIRFVWMFPDFIGDGR